MAEMWCTNKLIDADEPQLEKLKNMLIAILAMTPHNTIDISDSLFFNVDRYKIRLFHIPSDEKIRIKLVFQEDSDECVIERPSKRRVANDIESGATDPAK